jgi:hypothetical protein
MADTPEVAFADVNQLGDQVDIKYELPIITPPIDGKYLN